MHQKELNDIIERCKRNEPVAQERLYKHFFALMYHIAGIYSPDRQTIINLINEGFLKIFLNLETFDESKGNFESWAKQIVRNTCIDYVRIQKNHHKIISIEEHTETNETGAETPSTYTEEEVLYLINGLPSVTKRVFSMYAINGYSHKEISKMMDMAESTSRWHVGEARKTLKKHAHKIF